ncbi:MAG: agmatine deiminase family protein [Candidatus Riflebacteria bacterium]|nr:agmatine deiminase family protein [Candidatus Riflebacteria bacterium]
MKKMETVYFSNLLPLRFPSLFFEITKFLEEHDVSFALIPDTKDIWCRDYMPVQTASSKFMKFRYFPNYLQGKKENLVTSEETILSLPFLTGTVVSEIILDGGNVVLHGRKCIITEQIFRDNSNFSSELLKEEVKSLLNLEQLIIIPSEPGDITGHVDGVARFVDSNLLLVNDYSLVDPKYGSVLNEIFSEANLKLVKIPYQPSDEIYDGEPSAGGNYINFLQTDNVILVPAYNLPIDNQALYVIKQCFPNSAAISVNCADLAKGGGVLNCVSWVLKS